MAKANEHLKELLAKCGVSADIISKITGDDIPDEVANQIKAVNVFTKESALANPEIRKIHHAEALNGIDADVKRLMGVHALPDEDQAEVLKLEKSNQKIETFITKLAALKEKSAGASGKEKTALEKDIITLNEKFAAERKTWETKFSEQEAARLNDKVEWSVENIYAGLPYAMKDLPKDVNITTAKTVMSKIANEKGVKFTMTEKGLALVQKENGQPYFDEKNTLVSPQDFITKNLLANKMLQVSDGQQRNTNIPQFMQQNNVSTPENKKVGGMNQLDALLQESAVRDLGQ